jgi:oxygen-independent coproporphyrinogen III oxidase
MPKIGETGIYFHIPFCSKKCPYCHFFVIPHKKDLEDLLISNLKKEWQWRKPLLENKEILTVYFGGGTPSLLGPHTIAELLEMVGSSPKEVTLEVNPETVSYEKMAAYKKAGVNRISLGIQSLDDTELVVLGRGHAASKATWAIQTAKDAGFENITIDLMFELPGQTLATWERTLNQAVQLPITHISLYNLTFEPHTSFYKRQKELLPLVPNDEMKVAMLKMAIAKFESSEFKRYEISAFAKEGFTSLHNTGYWLARPFLGFGPSAFSFWEQKRFRNACSLQGWSDALAKGLSPVDFEEQLSPQDSFNELFAVQLRMLDGVDLANRGSVPTRAQDAIARLLQDGFLAQEETRVRLTEKGLLFYDDVASTLI